MCIHFPCAPSQVRPGDSDDAVIWDVIGGLDKATMMSDPVLRDLFAQGPPPRGSAKAESGGKRSDVDHQVRRIRASSLMLQKLMCPYNVHIWRRNHQRHCWQSH